jgi:hypothetical protein
MLKFLNCIFFEAYTCSLQMSSKDSEWRANIHGIEEHEAWGDWEGRGLLWMDLEASSRFTSTNHR